MTPAVLDYHATPAVQEVIDRLGRTEDIRFSPSRKRLAFSAFEDGRIVVLEIAVTPSPSGPLIFLSDYVMFSSKNIEHPHGMAFIDEDTLVVANRTQFVSIFRIPPAGGVEKEFVIKPLRIIWRNRFRRLDSPGSVDVYPIGMEEGGTKGVDVDPDSGVLAMTCEHQPLTFYVLETFLNQEAYTLNEAIRSSGSLPITGTMASSAG